MIEFDEKFYFDRWVNELGLDEHYAMAATDLAREAHDRAVKGMTEYPRWQHAHRAPEVGQPLPLSQPRTLFEDAALFEWQRLSNAKVQTAIGVAEYTEDGRRETAIRNARVFCKAVREAQEDGNV